MPSAAQHGCRLAVLARVDGQPEDVVGVDRVRPEVLGDVGPQLVHQADAAALVTRGVDEHATLLGGDDRRRLWRSWTPQSHRSEPSASPVRHSECKRTSTSAPSADVAHDERDVDEARRLLEGVRLEHAGPGSAGRRGRLRW